MFDPQTMLVSHFLAARAEELAADPAATGPWDAARQVLAGVRDVDADLAAAVEARDLAALRGILDQWAGGKRPLLEKDRDLLKRALRAFRKRLGLTQLDAESSVGGGPMSGGRRSGISGVSAPSTYPRAIWMELVKQGRLVSAGGNVFELGPGG